MNSHTEPTFCGFNSGSPQLTGGRPSPRRRDTFVKVDAFGGGVDYVMEATFEAKINVLVDAEVG